MKVLCLILAAMLGISNAGQVICKGGGQIAKNDGCVPAPPVNGPECPDSCRKSVGCTLEQREILLNDKVSTFEKDENCGYEYQEICNTIEANICGNVRTVRDTRLCGRSCEPVTRHICEPATRTVQVAKRRENCVDRSHPDCKKEWKFVPCAHDVTTTCMKWECIIPKIWEDVNYKQCTFSWYLEDETQTYTKCRAEEVRTCVLEDREIDYDVLEGCTLQTIEDCYEVPVPKTCPEIHTLVQTPKKVYVPVQVCNDQSGANSVPYYYDQCDSSECTTISEDVYQQLLGQA